MKRYHRDCSELKIAAPLPRAEESGRGRYLQGHNIKERNQQAFLSFVLCPFFRANFIFGGQKFARKQDKDRSDNGERHGGNIFFAEAELCGAVKAGR